MQDPQLNHRKNKNFSFTLLYHIPFKIEAIFATLNRLCYRKQTHKTTTTSYQLQKNPKTLKKNTHRTIEIKYPTTNHSIK